MERKSKPNWLLVVAIVPLMIIAILVESQFKYPAGVHEVADCAIVIVSFGLMVGWMRSNAAALEAEEIAKERWVFTEESINVEAEETEEFVMPVDSFTVRKHLPKAPRRHVGAARSAIDTAQSKGRFN